jgi:hypothetical protein
MPTSSRRASRLLQLVVVAALIVTVRLPFLLRADRFFDSDEAVEGLMALHAFHDELPVFLWGQRYKGVPEVYLASAIFSVAGPGVIALKAATLACFVVFGCLQFQLVRRLFSARVAWMTTALVVIGPPSLVLWSLSANAEVVLTLVAGALMGVALVQWQQSRSPVALATAAAAVGFGLWVQQYILYYVVALVIVVVQMIPERWARLRALVVGDGLPAWLRVSTRAALTMAVVYLAFGIVAFATGGFDVTVGGLFIGLRSPQKLWRIGAAILAIYCAVELVARLVRPDGRAGRSLAVAALAGFLGGYAPVLAASFQEGRRAPIPRMDVNDLRIAGTAIATEVLPMVVGFRSPTTEWLSVSPWFSLLFAAVVAVSFWVLWSRGGNPFFHVLLIVVPVLFIASASFVDAQSYRYLMPIHAALPVVLAIGVDEIARWNKLAALTVLGVMLGVSALEQAHWYRRLVPDARSPAIIECLRRNGARGAFADYWLSYKLTFLAGERIIVAPENGFDRYPPYTAFVRSLGLAPTDQPCRSLLLQ